MLRSKRSGKPITHPHVWQLYGCYRLMATDWLRQDGRRRPAAGGRPWRPSIVGCAAARRMWSVSTRIGTPVRTESPISARPASHAGVGTAGFVHRHLTDTVEGWPDNVLHHPADDSVGPASGRPSAEPDTDRTASGSSSPSNWCEPARCSRRGLETQGSPVADDQLGYCRGVGTAR